MSGVCTSVSADSRDRAERVILDAVLAVEQVAFTEGRRETVRGALAIVGSRSVSDVQSQRRPRRSVPRRARPALANFPADAPGTQTAGRAHGAGGAPTRAIFRLSTPDGDAYGRGRLSCVTLGGSTRPVGVVQNQNAKHTDSPLPHSSDAGPGRATRPGIAAKAGGVVNGISGSPRDRDLIRR